MSIIKIKKLKDLIASQAKHNLSLMFYILLLLLPLSISFSDFSDFKLFRLKILQTKKILMITETGIFIYNQNMEKQSTLIDLKNLISNENDFYYVTASQFTNLDNNIIILRIKQLFYLISDSNNELNTKLFETNLDDYASFPIQIIPYNLERQNNIKYYNIFIFYIDDSSYLNIEKFKVINNSTGYYIEKTKILTDSTHLSKSKSLNCKIMFSINAQKEIIVCFHLLNTAKNTLVITSFDLETQKIISELSTKKLYSTNAEYLDIVVNSEKSKSLICYNSNMTYCTIFNINENSFTTPVKIFDSCITDPETLLIKYIIDKNEYNIVCRIDDNIINILTLTSDFEIKSTNQNYENCYNEYTVKSVFSIYNFDLIFLSTKNNYFILATGLNGSNIFISEIPGECNKYIDKINFMNSTYNISSSYSSSINNTFSSSNFNTSSSITSSSNFSSSYSFSSSSSSFSSSNTSSSSSFSSSSSSYSNLSPSYYSNYIKPVFYKDGDIIKAITNMTKETVIMNINEIFKNIEIGKLYKIESEDFDIKISPLNNQTQSETYIDFLECEDILRNSEDLNNSILTLMLIEINKKDEQALNNQVEYAIYDENKNKLDLSKCENLTIKINYKIKNTSLIDNETISSLSEQGVNVFDANESFFNDICYPYSNNETDLILADRIANIFQNYSLCDNNCKYDHINMTKMTIECQCNVKTEISTEIEKLEFSTAVKSTFQYSNFFIISCYNLLFDLNNIKSNFGFFIILALITCQIPFLIHFSIIGLKHMKEFVDKEMEKNNFLLLTKKNKNEPPKKIKDNNSNNNMIDSLTLSQKNASSIERKLSKKYKTLLIDNNSKKLKKNKKSRALYQNAESSKRKFDDKDKEKEFLPKDYQKSSFSAIKKITDGRKIKMKKSSKENVYLSNDKKENDNNSYGNYNLIKIDANNPLKKNIKNSDYILNNYTFKEAVKNDMRHFFKIFWINLINLEIFLHTFIFKSPLEFKSLNIILLILSITTIFSFNALFYFNEKISDRFKYEGDNLFFFTLVNNLVISILSGLVYFFLILLNKLIHSKYKIENIFRNVEDKVKKNKKFEITIQEKKKIIEKVTKIIKNLKVKSIIFLTLNFILMLFFIYFVTAFCAIYKKTQISWISDSIVSLISVLIIEILIAFFNSSLYFTSIRYENECLYNISLFVYKLR